MQPAESTLAANTRRRVASRSRSGLVSSVNSMDKTLIHRPTQQQALQFGAHDPSSTTSSAAFTRLPGPDASNVRVTGEGLPVGANPGLRNQQNPGPDPAVAALLQSMNQLTAMFAAQSASYNTAVSTLSSQLEAQSSAFERQLAANSVVLSVITDRLNQLERNFETRPDPSNHDNRQSAGAPSCPRVQQSLRCDPRALESNRSRVRIPLTRRVSRKPSSHRCSVLSPKPRKSGLQQSR